MNDRSLAGDPEAFHCQQFLLYRIYSLVLSIPEAPTAEGSIVIHEITRLLENATLAAEDRWVEPGLLDAAPTQGKAYLSWLKGLAREHRVFKHPYYMDFIRNHAKREDVRTYVIQESVVDGRSSGGSRQMPSCLAISPCCYAATAIFTRRLSVFSA